MTEALRRAGISALALLLARAEFASIELSIAREQAVRWLLTALAACVLSMLGLIALSAVVALALWDRYGWYTVAVLAVLYCASAVMLVVRLLKEVEASPPLLSSTFAELAKDRDVLTSVVAPTQDDGGGQQNAR
ncbi:putative Membrane protein [Burkholderiales bacterium]|nr:putative Membrane protein [Burkholderiales bacterium]